MLFNAFKNKCCCCLVHLSVENLSLRRVSHVVVEKEEGRTYLFYKIFENFVIYFLCSGNKHNILGFVWKRWFLRKILMNFRVLVGWRFFSCKILEKFLLNML